MNTKKRKIYFASKISPYADSSMLIPVHPSMSCKEIAHAYARKTLDKEDYIHNGHWILRGIQAEGSFYENNLPSQITPYTVWNMVRRKIEDSDAMVAILKSHAYGTVLETGFAAGCGKLGVYVLPDESLGNGAVQDFWLAFQNALLTRKLWIERDIKSIPNFQKYGIYSISNYIDFISEIIPNFLKRSD